MESVSPYLKNDQRFRESDRVFNKWDRAYEGGAIQAVSLHVGIPVPPPLSLL